MVSWFILSWIPIYLAKKLPFGIFAAGFGQFLLFNREAYEKSGGHKKISSMVLDDFELARSVKSNGFNSDILDGTNLIETKGYESAIQAVDGHAKSIFATFRYKILIFLLAFFGLILLFYDDIDKHKQMCNDRTMIFHRVSRRDLCCVSENKGVPFEKQNTSF